MDRDMDRDMDRFIHRANLAHYRRLLAETDVANDHARRDMLLQLLSDEEARDSIPGPEHQGRGLALSEENRTSHEQR